MPNNESRKKRLRQDEKRQLANRQRRSAVKTAIRRLDEAVSSGNAQAVEEAVKVAYKRIDKAAKTNSLHANTASRRKALVMRKAATAKA